MKSKTEKIYQVETKGFFSGQWMIQSAHKSLARAQKAMQDNTNEGNRGARILKITTTTELIIEGMK